MRPQSSLYLVTKKDISNPVWFRNADQTIKADAAQLRMLIDREMQAPLAGDEMLTERAQALLDEMIIGYDYRDADDWTIGTWQRSESYFKLALIPREGKLSQLDLRDELKFVQLVHRYFPRLQSTIGRTRPVARDAPNRSADFYEYRWYHWNGSYEARWRVTNRLQIGQAMQVKYQDSWSLLDVVVSTVLFMKIGAEWWRSLRYFGDAILLAQINVRNLPVVRGSSLQFLKGFNIGETGNLGMRSEVLNVHSQQRSESSAYVQVNAATMVDTLPGTVTALMNPLLRTLGHAVLWREFEDNIRIIGSEILAR